MNETKGTVGMTPRALRTYTLGAIIVWVGVIFSSAFLVAGSRELPMLMIILGAGAFFFVVLIPAWLRTLVEPDE